MLKKHAEKIRFAIVGGANTAIDFVILFILVAMGLPVIASNFVSTSTALIFSFFANQKFTFKNTDSNNRSKFIYFLIITLFGLWIIQPIIIQLINSLLVLYQFDKSIVLLIGKLLATIITLVWNYLLYRKFIFNEDKK